GNRESGIARADCGVRPAASDGLSALMKLRIERDRGADQVCVRQKGAVSSQLTIQRSNAIAR
ncbi:hypothetical protein, partial [Xanthomonas vasicola]|uniref:hypothetical protein n=1 Tax=Xanthomonas vasicola TaxID=56459 RepID=UPI001F37DCD4